MTNTIISIDPGLTGGIAIVEYDVIKLFDMPTFKFETKTKTKSGNKKHKTEINIHALADMLRPYCSNSQAVVELVHSMPAMGAPSVFNFGMSFGILLGVLATLEIPYELVTPQRWKKDMMDGTAGKEKEADVLRAVQLYPKLRDQLIVGKKYKDGLADALLMARWLQLKENALPKESASPARSKLEILD